MKTKPFLFPALYETANTLSAKSQRLYLGTLIFEYFLLLSAAIASMNFYATSAYFAIPAGILVVSVAVLLFRSWKKPEQDWYRGRALAESIKTSCWRYCMRAEPFGDADNLAVRKAEFRNHLLGILKLNRQIGDRLPTDAAAKDQITPSMEKTRSMALDARAKYYDVHRIRDQRSWYAKKAAFNKRSSFWWVVAIVVAYCLAIGMSVLRIAYPTFAFWPVEPFIVVASSMIGWMQIKKFNELASSYTLTALEIGIIQTKVGEVRSEADFSAFVNEAEQAFSREHTQWVARQQQV